MPFRRLAAGRKGAEALDAGACKASADINVFFMRAP